MYNIYFKGNINKKNFDNEYLPSNSLIISVKEKSIINGNVISGILIIIVIMTSLYLFLISDPILNHTVIELLFFIFIGLIGFIPIFLLHEILHALCFPKKAKKEIWYEINKNSIFLFSFQMYSNTLLKRNKFLFMTLLPNILLSWIPLILWYSGIINTTPFFSRIIGSLLTILFTCGAADYSLFFNVLYQSKKKEYIILYQKNFYRVINK